MTAAVGLRRINAGKGHWYKIDGKKVDGVTTLLKNGKPNNALISWAARRVARYVADHLDLVNDMADMGPDSVAAALEKIPFTERNRAAVRGTRVHKLAEHLVQNLEVEVDDDMAGYVEALIQWFDEWQVQPVLVEAVVGSRTWAYGGTTDLVADVTPPGDVHNSAGEVVIPAGLRVRAIFDPKTSDSGLHPTVCYQLAAYAGADVYLDADCVEQPMAALGIQYGFGVWVRSDGYDVQLADIGPDTFRTFTFIASVARRTANEETLLGPPVYPKEIIA
jgi:hypothetical protein